MSTQTVATVRARILSPAIQNGSMTQVELHSLDDRRLQRLVGAKAARYVQNSRTDWRALGRLTIARMYGRDILGPDDDHIVPCITERVTFGVVDTETGTAWDSRISLERISTLPPRTNDDAGPALET